MRGLLAASALPLVAVVACGGAQISRSATAGSVARFSGGKLVQAFGATALDLTVVMDSSGRVVSRTTTPIDDAAILAALGRAGVA